MARLRFLGPGLGCHGQGYGEGYGHSQSFGPRPGPASAPTPAPTPAPTTSTSTSTPTPTPTPTSALAAALGLAILLAACATEEARRPPDPSQVRATVTRLLPEGTRDAGGWASDIQTAFSLLGLEPSVEQLCSAIAVIQQESSFRADPAVPNLASIAWKEIDDRAAAIGLPSLIVRTAMRVPSSDGRSYAERIDAAKTERDLSETFEDLIGRLPLGQRLFSGWNPVRTGGPMQVSVAWSEAYAAQRRYPYPDAESIRREVFTRRGGLYFGIAHLLDYPASYDRPIYRFADFNAGHYASRNAAFQAAVARLTQARLALDGDLVAPGGADKPGETERALRQLGSRLKLDDAAIRRDLERSTQLDFERTAVYRGVFALADAARGRDQQARKDAQDAKTPQDAKTSQVDRAPRAVLPQIRLTGPKISRQLTTAWFAERVDGRRKLCVARAPAAR